MRTHSLLFLLLIFLYSQSQQNICNPPYPDLFTIANSLNIHGEECDEWDVLNGSNNGGTILVQVYNCDTQIPGTPDYQEPLELLLQGPNSISELIPVNNAGNSFQNLEDGTYTITLLDSNGYPIESGTYTIACDGCIDPNIIDDTYLCPIMSQSPVCGCDGEYYNSACEAYYHNGVTSWTIATGPDCSIDPPCYITVINEITHPKCSNPQSGGIYLNVYGSGLYTYEWMDNNGNILNPANPSDLQNLSAGIYTVTISDLNDPTCFEVLSFELNSPEEMIINSTTTDPYCGVNQSGNYYFILGSISLDISSGTPPYFITWSNGEIDTEEVFVDSGDYSVVVQDSDGCLETLYFTINDLNDLSITVSNTNVLCADDPVNVSVDITGGTAPYTTIWYGVENEEIDINQIYDPNTLYPGEYVVVVTDVCGFSTEQYITITDLSNPIELFLDIICEIDVQAGGISYQNIDLAVSGGTGVYTYVWSNGETTQDLYEVQDGKYTVTVFDENGCTANTSIEVQNLELSTEPICEPISCPIGININTDNCIDDSFVWNLSIQSTCDPLIEYTFDGTGYSNNSYYSDILQSIDGCDLWWITLDYFEWVNNCPDGFSEDSFIELTSCDEPFFQVEGNLFSPEDALFSEVTYEETFEQHVMRVLIDGVWTDWTPAQSPAISLVNPPETCTCSNSYLPFGACVHGKHYNSGTLDQYEKIICMPLTLPISGSIDLTVSGGEGPYTYEWDNGAITEDITDLEDGEYCVSVTDSNGCKEMICENIDCTPCNIELSADLGCSSIDLTVSGGTPPYTYLWSGTLGEIYTTEDLENVPAGEYSIIVMDSGNPICSSSQFMGGEPPVTFEITEENTMEISADISCENGQISTTVIGGSGDYSYEWSTGETTEYATIGDNEEYCVTVTDQISGCKSVFCQEVSCCELELSYDILCDIEPKAGVQYQIIDLIVSGGNPPYSYQWTNDNGININSNQDLNYAIPGENYTIQVLDSKECIRILTITLPLDPFELTLDSECGWVDYNSFCDVVINTTTDDVGSGVNNSGLSWDLEIQRNPDPGTSPCNPTVGNVDPSTFTLDWSYDSQDIISNPLAPSTTYDNVLVENIGVCRDFCFNFKYRDFSPDGFNDGSTIEITVCGVPIIQIRGIDDVADWQHEVRFYLKTSDGCGAWTVWQTMWVGTGTPLPPLGNNPCPNQQNTCSNETNIGNTASWTHSSDIIWGSQTNEIVIDYCISLPQEPMLDLTVLNGTPPYTYEWTKPNSYDTNDLNQEDINGYSYGFYGEDGEYCVTVTDASNCSTSICDTLYCNCFWNTEDFDSTNFNPSPEDTGYGINGFVDNPQTQFIDLNQGWNIMSTYLVPENENIGTVFEDILSDVTIVKDEIGQVLWPSFNLNSIGDMEIGAGYQVKMVNENILEIEGELIMYNTSFPLEEGWNMIGYLHQDAYNIEDMMNPIIDELSIIKDEAGNVYWPEFGLNNIGNMEAGEGYQIKIDNTYNFSYPSGDIQRYAFLPKLSTTYFDKPINTGSNMIIGLPLSSWSTDLSIGDEIAAYDQNNRLIGSTVYEGSNLALTVWGDDLTTDKKDGLYVGEKFDIKLFRNHGSILEDITVNSWKQGTGSYNINGISVAGSISSNIIEEKQLIKVTDIIGREVNNKSQQSTLFYIYDDGTVERKYIIK